MNAHNTLTRDVRLVGMLSSDWRAGPSRLSNKKRDVAYENPNALLLCCVRIRSSSLPLTNSAHFLFQNKTKN